MSISALPKPRVEVVEDVLGPAVVVSAGCAELVVRLGSGVEARATLALAFPYRAAEGDVVLVIGRGADLYVIGVLRGSGATTLAFEGDVAVRASGTLELSGDSGVRVRGAALDVAVGSFRVVADAMVHKVASAVQRVTGLLSVRAGETQTVVDGTATSRAKDAVMLTEGKTTINGKQIFLG